MRKKLILLFILVVIIPFFLSIYLISDLITERFESILNNRASNSLIIADNVYEKYIEDVSLKTKILSQLKEVQNSVLQKDSLSLINTLSFVRDDLNISTFNGIIEVYDQKGEYLVSDPKIAQKLTSSEVINDTLNREIKSYSYFVDNQLTITSAYPLFHDKIANPVGVISISSLISDRIVDEIKKISDTEVLIFYKKKDGYFKTLATTFIIEGERYEPVITVLAENGLPFENVLIKGKSYLMRFQRHKVADGEFFLAVLIEKNELFNIIDSLVTALYIIGAFAVVVALLFAIFYSKSITDPITSLVDFTKTLGAGNWEKEIYLNTNDEFQTLAESFDKMRLKIKRKLDDLKLINRINNKIINKKGDKPINEILQIILEVMKVERSSIMLLDESNKNLNLRVVCNKDDDNKKIKEYISFEVGEGIAGYVAETGKEIYSNNPLEDPRFKKYPHSRMNSEMKNILCFPMKDDKDKIMGVINIVNREGGFTEEDRDIFQEIANQSAIAIQSSQLYEDAIKDGMTGLFIHRYFQARLETELKRSQRYNEKISLIMFDIDHFKNFNDTYGHQVGDIVIKKVAGEVMNRIREGIDIPARYGGEEFAIIMPETTIEGAMLWAERFRKNIEEMEVKHEDKTLKVTISMGCAEFPVHAQTKNDLIEKADKALYRSKEAGRNHVSQADV